MRSLSANFLAECLSRDSGRLQTHLSDSGLLKFKDFLRGNDIALPMPVIDTHDLCVCHPPAGTREPKRLKPS